MIYQVDILPPAQKMVLKITDRRIQEKLLERMTALANDPESQGKPLGDDLAGYRSVRAVGQRYRIIYRMERATVTVVVVAAGIRKEGGGEDIYRVAEKLIRLGLL
ncbi:MAG: type II toxin-antitoxin system RelE/ParE family toxin [Acidobacteriota bacterium]|nr:type II toxin-antitoxin system RelE/ParE family toxin [Acidobacteriota bacterium]